MNNEIKEILDEEVPILQLSYGNYVSLNKYLRLKDYITNLQQENQTLQENNQSMQEEMARTWQKCDDYKSRCEKANNQLKIIMQIIKEQPTRNVEDDEWIENRLIGIVNILQNGSEK